MSKVSTFVKHNKMPLNQILSALEIFIPQIAPLAEGGKAAVKTGDIGKGIATALVDTGINKLVGNFTGGTPSPAGSGPLGIPIPGVGGGTPIIGTPPIAAGTESFADGLLNSAIGGAGHAAEGALNQAIINYGPKPHAPQPNNMSAMGGKGGSSALGGASVIGGADSKALNAPHLYPWLKETK